MELRSAAGTQLDWQYGAAVTPRGSGRAVDYLVRPTVTGPETTDWTRVVAQTPTYL